MSRVEIRRACMRDASYIVAHMRASDWEEVECQLEDGVEPYQLAHAMIMGEHVLPFVAYLDGKPACLFGMTAKNRWNWDIWAIGTDAMRRTVPAVTDYLAHEVVPAAMERGCRHAEARSLATHYEAHHWMRSCGADQIGHPFEYGKRGERFILWHWTVSQYRAISRKRKRFVRQRKDQHRVHLQPTEDTGGSGRHQPTEVG